MGYHNLVKTVFAVSLVLFPASFLRAEESNWQNTAAFGINAARGNSDSIFTTLGFDSERKRSMDTFRSVIQASYGEKDNEIVAKDAAIISQYNRTVTPKTFWLLSGSLEHNEVSDIDYRYTVSPGYGYYFIKEDDRLLEVSAGIAYVGQKFSTGEEDDYIATQLSERFEWTTENSKIWNSLSFLPDVSDFSDFILRGEVGFEAELHIRWGLRLVLRNIYDSSPPPGRENNDLMFISMLTLKM